MRVEGRTAIVEFNLGATDVVRHEDIEPVVKAVYEFLQSAPVDVVKITGRGPTWLYAATTHAAAHMAKCVATFDAVNRRYVVVVTHSPDYKLGQVVE